MEKENVGGQIAFSPRVENFPSIKQISGSDFSNNVIHLFNGADSETIIHECFHYFIQPDEKELKDNYNEKNCIFCNVGHLFGEHVWSGAF